MIHLRPRRWLVTLVLVLLSPTALAAGAAPATAPSAAAAAAAAAKASFDAARAGDLNALKALYSERAWRLISAADVDPSGAPLDRRLAQRMAGVIAIDVTAAARETGATASVAVTLREGGDVAERCNLFLRRIDGRWRIDAPDDGDGPFCIDDWACAAMVWEAAYHAAENLRAPGEWYAQEMRGLRRALTVAGARPDSVVALYDVGNIYLDQLASAPQRVFAVARIRHETQGSKAPGGGEDPAAVHPVLLDGHGHLLTAARFAHLARYDAPAAGGFPYGLSPAALAFDFFKRAQALNSDPHARHPDLAASVVDSRPALALKTWAEEELTRGRRRELEAFGIEPPAERAAMDPLSPRINLLLRPTHPELLAEAEFSYGRAAKLCADADAEYDRHVKAFPQNKIAYSAHREELAAMAEAAAGDADAVRVITSADPAARAQAVRSAANHYAAAKPRYAAIAAMYAGPQDAEDRAEFEQVLRRIGARLADLAAAGAKPAARPD